MKADEQVAGWDWSDDSQSLDWNEFQTRKGCVIGLNQVLQGYTPVIQTMKEMEEIKVKGSKVEEESGQECIEKTLPFEKRWFKVKLRMSPLTWKV